jgi:protein TonB
MFEQSLIAPGKTRRERTIALALLLQSAAVSVLILMPLMGIEPLQAVRRFMILPPTKLAPQPEPVPQTAPPSGSPRTRFAVLTDMPRHLVAVPHMGPLLLTDVPEIQGPAIPGSASTGGFGSLGIPAIVAATAPTAPVEKQPQRPVPLTSRLSQSQLIYGPKPAYPRLAVLARVEGTVRLQAIISRNGQIENLHVISGPALLINAAMETVREWRYRPLLLNGEPVEVITEVDVTFTLHP